MKLKKSVVLVCPGFALLCAVCHGQQMGFGGPAVLSGGAGAVGRTAGNMPISLRPYLGVDARYDSNLGDPGDTTKPNDNAYGLTGTWGLYGLRQGEGYILALDYHGLYRQYAGSKRNGVSHFGMMNYVQQLGPTTDMYASGGVSIYRYGLNGYRTALIPAEVLPDVGDPDSEVFDSPTHAYRASIGIRKVMSSRVAVQFGGDGFEIRRPQNLISSRGGNGTASVSYALGPNRNVGATYQYNYHFFPNGYGQTTMHNLSANFNQQLSPTWYFTGSAGVLRSENDRLVRVQLDPEIAELTGQSSTLEAQHRVTFRPIYRIMFTRRLENGTLSIFYRRSSSPGNGFVISSLRENWEQPTDIPSRTSGIFRRVSPGTPMSA